MYRASWSSSCISQDSNLCAAGSGTGTVHVWSTNSGEMLRQLQSMVARFMAVHGELMGHKLRLLIKEGIVMGVAGNVLSFDRVKFLCII